MGCGVSTDIAAIGAADVVYVLRMQRERMEVKETTSQLREYTARWGVTQAWLRLGQKVMHPRPMNRGVEIDPAVADSVDALIETQAAARRAHGRPLRPAHPRSGRGQGRGDGGGGLMADILHGREGHDDLVVRSARVIDPSRGMDDLLDVRVDKGVIADIGLNVSPNGHRVVEGRGLVLAPAFVDPHVHLRTPGREDEETIASGTAAAAAGGFCAILAMPNTDPVVDSAAVLGSLIETAREEAEVPVGFLAAITKGQFGEELSEMAELADAGAAGFSDDGLPVVAPGLMRRALQYHAITDRRVVHCGSRPLPFRLMHEGPSPPSSASPATLRGRA
jgi:hypothetical protein